MIGTSVMKELTVATDNNELCNQAEMFVPSCYAFVYFFQSNTLFFTFPELRTCRNIFII